MRGRLWASLAGRPRQWLLRAIETSSMGPMTDH